VKSASWWISRRRAIPEMLGLAIAQPVRLCNSEPLMISLAVIVDHNLGERVPKQCRPDEDHPIQTLFLEYRP
jgi:hypothetical protein